MKNYLMIFALFLLVLPFQRLLAQGLVFSEADTGTVIVSDIKFGKQLDLDGDAAKSLYLQLKADRTSEKLIGRNAAGKHASDAIKNKGIKCSKLLSSETYHCQIGLQKAGGIMGCSQEIIQQKKGRTTPSIR